MGWYRTWHGMPEDAKLASAAKRAGAARAHVLALWVTLLDKASRNRPRGTVEDLDSAEMSDLLDIPHAITDKILTAFRDKRMLTSDNRIAAWDRLQKTSTRRVRQFRNRAHEFAMVDRAEKRAAELAPIPPEHAGKSGSKNPKPHPDNPAETALRRERLRAELARKKGFHTNRHDIAPSPRIAALLRDRPFEE